MAQQKVLYIPPQSHTDRVFRPEMFQRFQELFDVTVNPDPEQYTTERVAAEIAGYDALVTGWGSPPMSDEVFENGEKLQIIAHSAGSVKFLVTPEQIEKYLKPRGITIFSANHAIGYNVAEATIGLLIMASRRWPDFILSVRMTDHWRDPHIPGNGQYLLGATVGVVAASKVGREVIRMLQPFYCRILCYDPYLTAEEAEELAVEKVELNDLFKQSDLVTVHLPKIPATQKMIGAEQLGLMKEGALLVNTSRGAVIDQAALYEAAKARKIRVALDVTDPEPMPPEDPMRRLPNVYITPHVSGAGFYGYFKIGETTVQALLDRFTGRPVDGGVPLENWDRLA